MHGWCIRHSSSPSSIHTVSSVTLSPATMRRGWVSVASNSPSTGARLGMGNQPPMGLSVSVRQSPVYTGWRGSRVRASVRCNGGMHETKSCTQPTDEPTGPAGGDQGCNWVWVPPGSRARHPEACGKLEGRPDGVRIRPEATPRNCLDLALDSWNDACQVSLVSTILSGCFFFSLVFCIPSPGSILMHPSLPLRATGAAWSPGQARL